MIWLFVNYTVINTWDILAISLALWTSAWSTVKNPKVHRAPKPHMQAAALKSTFLLDSQCPRHFIALLTNGFIHFIKRKPLLQWNASSDENHTGKQTAMPVLAIKHHLKRWILLICINPREINHKNNTKNPVRNIPACWACGLYPANYQKDVFVFSLCGAMCTFVENICLSLDIEDLSFDLSFFILYVYNRMPINSISHTYPKDLWLKDLWPSAELSHLMQTIRNVWFS